MKYDLPVTLKVVFTYIFSSLLPGTQSKHLQALFFYKFSSLNWNASGLAEFCWNEDGLYWVDEKHLVESFQHTWCVGCDMALDQHVKFAVGLICGSQYCKIFSFALYKKQINQTNKSGPARAMCLLYTCNPFSLDLVHTALISEPWLLPSLLGA